MTSTICVSRDTRRLVKFCLILLVLNTFYDGLASPIREAYAIEAHPGSAAESLYSEAVLAYNRKQTKEAVRILDDLLKNTPDHLPALELMALTLKDAGNDVKALEVYERLLKLKPDQAGPYHFELGIIRHRQKKPLQAADHFEKALQNKFNEAASNLFLGLIAFDSGNLNAAEKHFSEVKRKGNPELKIVGHYYTGMIQFKNGNGAIATAEINEARSLARDLPESKMASDIRVASDKILAPFNTSQWFASLTFLGQYDSNISLIPSGAASAQASQKATPNLTLSGGGGRMSSPVGSFQWVVSYRFSANKTMAADTKSYDFFTQTPSLHLTYRPLGPTSVGVKAEGNIAFQNRSEDPTNPNVPHKYRPYSVGVEVGPFVKFSPSEGWGMNVEVAAKPQKNYSDTNLSGQTVLARLSLKGTTGSGFLNPGFNALFEKNQATGADNRYQSMGGGVSNYFRFGADDTMNASIDFLQSRYPDSSALRSDTNVVGRLSYIHRFNAKWSLLGDFTYVKNSSSEAAVYSYNRMTAGLGLGWTF